MKESEDMKMKFCQCCGMPMEGANYGKEKDGTLSEDYCEFCYADGEFTTQCTMDEMIEQCVPFCVEADPTITEEQARASMKAYFPTLKRWALK